jgi:hypothetical protein
MIDRRLEGARGRRIRFALAAFTVAHLIAAPAQSRAELPEVTHDGLHLVRHTGFQAFYMKPGSSLAGYSEVKILDCFVAFKKHWAEEQRSEGNLRVSTRSMDEIKKHLATEFERVFEKQMQNKGAFEVVTEPGPTVLILRPAIVNLDIEAPDPTEQIDETTFSASAGQMTLYLELYDSMTSDLIARAIDAESDQGFGAIEWQNGVSNVAAADRILERWAERLRDLLGKAKTQEAPPAE